ncbi:ISL3 family transposase [Schaalia sp. ZJ405]|uniref:ISL3 family transposase n=1 Tax=Schaalia sp. ZJ405 TaxID=2709403 RepID=UPI0013EADA60|nr:ISL3 family transposase [Schaalia sp. ZJ405]QPK81210.1 ISL3 family transposase [Schaalia sp. ZJ405]
MSVKDVRVLGYFRDGPVQAIVIEQSLSGVVCPACGGPARVKDRPRVMLVDLPVYGRPMRLVWRKHRFTCPDLSCEQMSWTSTDRRIASSRCRMTTRAGKWATEQVGKGRTVSEVARELGCDWHTVNDTVMFYGSALLEADRKRVNVTGAVGLDETSFVRLAHRRTQYVTTVCDVEHHQIIDIVPSRTYVDVATYLHAQPQAWKDHIRYATLDMSPTYRAVYTVVLPKATQIADHFHVIMLANRALDEVRRRVQQETLSHRGRKHDPLYQIRKTLTRAQETLNQDTSERLAHLLALGDPNGEVAIAYRIKEQLRVFYRLNNSDQAYRELDTLIDTCQARPMPPEIKRLGRTLNQWRSQIMAYHKAHLTNSITETMNNLIKRTKRIGYGFTNFTNYRIRVLLYAGKPNWRILNTIYP